MGEEAFAIKQLLDAERRIAEVRAKVRAVKTIIQAGINDHLLAQTAKALLEELEQSLADCAEELARARSQL